MRKDINEYVFRELMTCEAADSLPRLFNIYYFNMCSISPFHDTYTEEQAKWVECIFDAIKKPQRKIILILRNSDLAGFFMYYINNLTFMMEEIQFTPQCQGTGLLRQLYLYLLSRIPLDTEHVEAYSHKNNIRSQDILAHLGLEKADETPDGYFYHYKGRYDIFRDTIFRGKNA